MKIKSGKLVNIVPPEGQATRSRAHNGSHRLPASLACSTSSSFPLLELVQQKVQGYSQQSVRQTADHAARPAPVHRQTDHASRHREIHRLVDQVESECHQKPCA